MDYYIIDGNNLIGKVPELSKLQKKNKQLSREKAAFIIDNFFSLKHWKGSLHFDGHPNNAIKSYNLKIIYSQNKIADDMIKDEIERSNQRARLVIVSSDLNLLEFARVCGCKYMSSSEFASKLKERSEIDEEEKRTKEINNDEIKRLFGE